MIAILHALAAYIIVGAVVMHRLSIKRIDGDYPVFIALWPLCAVGAAANAAACRSIARRKRT